MASKKKTLTRNHARKPASKPAARPSHEIHVHAVPSAVPLRTQTAAALQNYFAHLDGDHPRHLYDMVLREVEEPLFRAVLAYVDGNQSRAAEVLGLNRGTLRKKLREHGLAPAEL